MTAQVAAESRRSTGPGAVRRRHFVGGFFLFTAGIHVGIVGADPEYYRPFGDEAALDVVRTAWAEVFMAEPAAWGLAVAAGELLLGLLLLLGHRWARVGWAGVIGFHLALSLFGWGFLLWTVPALAFLVPAARADWRHLA